MNGKDKKSPATSACFDRDGSDAQPCRSSLCIVDHSRRKSSRVETTSSSRHEQDCGFVPRRRDSGDRARSRFVTVLKDHHHEPSLQPCVIRGSLRQSEGNRIPSWISCGVRDCRPRLLPQHLSWSQPGLSCRLRSRDFVQNVLLPQHRCCAPVLLLTQPLPRCRLSREKPVPPAEPLRTAARHLLHSAAVRRSASCHPSHDCGATQWHASRHVCPAHCSSPPEWGHHGHGRGHHHGHVRRDVINYSLPDCSCPAPFHAHVPLTHHAHLQLRAPAVVNTAGAVKGRYAFSLSRIFMELTRHVFSASGSSSQTQCESHSSWQTKGGHHPIHTVTRGSGSLFFNSPNWKRKLHLVSLAHCRTHVHI